MLYSSKHKPQISACLYYKTEKSFTLKKSKLTRTKEKKHCSCKEHCNCFTTLVFVTTNKSPVQGGTCVVWEVTKCSKLVKLLIG